MFKRPKRIIFMGTPEFAVPSLKALVSAGAYLVSVYTQPPRPKGRGYQIQMSPVHEYALEKDLPVLTPTSLKSEEAEKTFAALCPDLIVVAAYGLILPPAILKIPPCGAINVHASLLPRWRGAAPIQRALLAGDPQTGVTIMEVEEGLDTGPMLSWAPVPISDDTTAVSLTEELAELGATLLLSTLEKGERGEIVPTPQPLEGMSYATKIVPAEGMLLWDRSVRELHRQVRALNPWPGTWFLWKGKRIKVVEAGIKEGISAPHVQPGAVVTNHLAIQAKDGLFYPVKVKPEGGKVMSVEAFLRGNPIPLGTHL